MWWYLNFPVSVCIEVKLSAKVILTRTNSGVWGIFMHIMGLLAVQKKLVMDGRYASVDCNTNASEHGESEGFSFCGYMYVDQHW